MGYKIHAIKGVSWIGGIRVVTRVLSFVKTLVIARILIPNQFGIFGIATLVLSLIEILTETGINIFLVQHKEKVDEYINTAWIISILRGLVIACSIVIFSPLIAGFFHSPDSLRLLLLISIVPLARGFINPSIVTFQKELEFHKEFYYRSSVFLLETVLSIILVVITHETTSLVWAIIASAVLEIFLSFMIAKPTPSFTFEVKRFKEIIVFGKWITFATISNYFYQHGDDIVVGRLLGTSSLGLYDMAYRISLVPLTDIGDVIAKVTFPVYVKISSDKKRLRIAFIKTLCTVIALTTPIGLVLFLFSETIIRIVLGERWLGAAPALKVLGIFGIIRAISVFSASLFLSVQKQQVFTIITCVGFFGLGITLIPFTIMWGILGAAYSALFGTILTLPVIYYYYKKLFRN